jgi:hypothetical protein
MQYFEGTYVGLRGFDAISLDPLSLPMLEILPNRITGLGLYSIVQLRLKEFLKGDVSLLRVSFERENDRLRERRKSDDIFYSMQAACDSRTAISSASTENVLSGPVPSRGFTLRLITGGDGPHVSCSRCSWISRCEGCVVPDSNHMIELRDGESVAIDWHVAVYEELLKKEIMQRVVPHGSLTAERQRINSQRIPLSKCLEKFSESERLDDVVCPRCKDCNKLQRKFTLWRLPPVLVIQLKRFQFDRVSRKKLNQRVEFPRNNLDLKEFLAPSRLTSLSVAPIPEGVVVDSSPLVDESTAANICNLALSEMESENDFDSLCTDYQLASVIHHEGVLGGGHYVATVRTSTLSDPNPEHEQWTLFNDHAVSSMSDLSDVTDSSAYVLFYVRKDCIGQSVQNIFDAPPIHTDCDNRDIVRSQPAPPLTLSSTSTLSHTDTIFSGGSTPKSKGIGIQRIPATLKGKADNKLGENKWFSIV